MKIQLLLEVFDKPSMDGVQIVYETRTSCDYKFIDPSIGDDTIYKVSIYSEIGGVERSIADVPGIGTKYPEAIELLKGYTGTASIFLSASVKGDDSSYSKTKLNNQWFVYSKLLACISHYVTTRKPMMLKFSGASQDMDLVYDKFIKMSGRLDPANKHEHLTGEYYIRSDVKTMLQEKLGVSLEPKDAVLRSERLAGIKKRKQEQRQREMRRAERDSDWFRQDIDDNPFNGIANPSGYHGLAFDDDDGLAFDDDIAPPTGGDSEDELGLWLDDEPLEL